MKLVSLHALDQLATEETCLAAAFTSYGFTPSFFEDHVLRAILRLSSDPAEQPDRYHAEATRALQATPVVAIVDSGEREAGRRLPYDLLEVPDLVFHPKSALLLYEKMARLMVGSGNLTFPGYRRNTELFLVLDLSYDDRASVALLRAYGDHLRRVFSRTRQRGSQMQLFREAFEGRVREQEDVPDATASAVLLLDSLAGPILDQLFQQLPKDAKLLRIGMLAPFFERDDDVDELDIDSVFGALKKHSSPQTVLDIGVRWENAQVKKEDGAVVSLNDGLDRLWGWTDEQDGAPVVYYGTLAKISPNSVTFIDDRGDRRRWPLDEAEEAIKDGSLWVLPKPEVYAPARTIAAAHTAFSDVNVWLHPAKRFNEKEPVDRPLHAKLLTIAYRSKGSEQTLVLMGSANMSRRALLLKAGSGMGNAELGLAFRIDGAYSLVDFVSDPSELIYAPQSVLDFRERKFPAAEVNYALMVDEANHDPVTSTLKLIWSRQVRQLPPWRLTYVGEELASSDVPPTAALLVERFLLRQSSAEIFLHVDNQSFAIPILVTDLVSLPAAPDGISLGLQELLMLISRRIGIERSIEIARRRKRAKKTNDHAENDLGTFFEGKLTSTDVFRAWWAAAEDLRDPNISFFTFRLRLEGAFGVGEAWKRMISSLREGNLLSSTEVWLYGSELLRSLETEVDLSTVKDAAAKKKVLRQFIADVRVDLASIRWAGDHSSWVRRIQSFYKAPFHVDI